MHSYILDEKIAVEMQRRPIVADHIVAETETTKRLLCRSPEIPDEASTV